MMARARRGRYDLSHTRNFIFGAGVSGRAYAFGGNWRPVFFIFAALALVWGVVFLACFALACLGVHYLVLVRPGGGSRPGRST